MGTEAIHSVMRPTPATFDRYVEIYGEFAIPTLQDAGIEILGAWSFASGLLGRDMILLRFDSLEDRAEKTEAMAGDRRVAVELMAAMTKAGIQIGEDVAQAAPLGYATEERFRATLDSSDASQPRQYALRRHLTILGQQVVAYGALKTLASAAEAGGKKRLALAYEQNTGRRGTLSEIWVAPAPSDLSDRSSDGNLEAHDDLQSAIAGGGDRMDDPPALLTTAVA